MKNLLLDLRDAVWNLRNENAQLKQLNLQGTDDVLCNLRREHAQLKQMNEELQRSNEVKEASMKATIKELEDKDAALAAIATMFRSGSSCSSFRWVWVGVGFLCGVCFGLMFGAM